MLYQKCALLNYVKMLLVCKIFYRVFLINAFNQTLTVIMKMKREKISVIYLFTDTRASGPRSKQIALSLGIKRG